METSALLIWLAFLVAILHEDASPREKEKQKCSATDTKEDTAVAHASKLPRRVLPSLAMKIQLVTNPTDAKGKKDIFAQLNLSSR